jgi:hypothetical protein
MRRKAKYFDARGYEVSEDEALLAVCKTATVYRCR